MHSGLLALHVSDFSYRLWNLILSNNSADYHLKYQLQWSDNRLIAAPTVVTFALFVHRVPVCVSQPDSVPCGWGVAFLEATYSMIFRQSLGLPSGPQRPAAVAESLRCCHLYFNLNTAAPDLTPYDLWIQTLLFSSSAQASSICGGFLRSLDR